MANILDWKNSDDTRDIVHILVQALVEGNLVALPVETAYHVFASGLHPQAIEQLKQLEQASKVRAASLFLRSSEEALDYSPHMSTVAERAVRRAWPGPLVLELPAKDQSSLAHRLPEATQQLMMPEEPFLAQRVPTHPAIISAMRLMSGPLVGAACLADGEPLCTGAEVKTQFDEHVTLILDDGRTHYSGLATQVRIDGNECRLQQAGVLPPEVVDQMFQLIVLLVCTGNTCRSPMAEALLRHLLEEAYPDWVSRSERSTIYISSAGISAFPGGPASVEAQHVMEKRGLSLKAHQSRALSERSLRFADLVLTMTNSHRAGIMQEMPQFEDKLFLLSGGQEDVSDPFGGTEAIYLACADQIESYLKRWVEKLDSTWFPKWTDATS